MTNVRVLGAVNMLVRLLLALFHVLFIDHGASQLGKMYRGEGKKNIKSRLSMSFSGKDENDKQVRTRPYQRRRSTMKYRSRNQQYGEETISSS